MDSFGGLPGIDASGQRGSGGLGLDWLAGCGKDVFLRSFWDQKFLFVARRNTSFYKPVIGPEDVAELANLAVRLSDRTRVRPLVQLVGGEKSAGLVRLRNTAESAASMWRSYDQGATILVQVAQQYWPPLKRMCDTIESELRAPVDATLICTPPGSQAFGRHYDRLNALVIQLSGKKRWRLFGRAIADPLQELPLLPFETAEMGQDRLARWETADRADSVASADIMLEAGDFLYVPRGIYHEVWAEEEAASAHITLAIKPVTYLDLMLAAIARYAEREPNLRRVLPLPMSARNEIVVAPHIRSLAKTLAVKLDVEEALADLEIAFAGSRACHDQSKAPQPATRIRDNSLIAHVSEDRPTVVYNRGHAEFYYGDRLFRVPPKAGAALEFIAVHSRFRVSDVPGLTPDSVVTLIRRLIRANVLRALAET